MKSFVIKLVSVLMVAGALVSYNMVLENRSKNEEIARLTAELENSRQAADEASGGQIPERQVSGGQASERQISGEQTAEEQTAGADYADGTYTGEAEGFGGTIQVEVSIQQGKITDISIVSAENEDGTYLSMAQDIIPVILEQQSAEVDTISGATFSSTGIRDAVAQAIEKAGN